MEKALAHQNLIIDSAEEMTRNVDLFFVDQEQRRQARTQLLNAKFEKYISGLKSIVSKSEDKLKDVTGQYLILRHNARIAREVLMQNQSKLGKEKQLLVEKISRMRIEVEEQLTAAENKFENEMNTVVGQRRSEVLSREEELECEWAALEEARNFYNNDGRSLKKREKKLKAKLQRLTSQRLHDLSSTENELKSLRAATHAAEMEQLYGKARGDPLAVPLDASSANRRLNSLSAADISILNQRLSGLKIVLENNDF